MPVVKNPCSWLCCESQLVIGVLFVVSRITTERLHFLFPSLSFYVPSPRFLRSIILKWPTILPRFGCWTLGSALLASRYRSHIVRPPPPPASFRPRLVGCCFTTSGEHVAIFFERGREAAIKDKCPLGRPPSLSFIRPPI